MLINRIYDGSLSFSVYRKPVNTGRQLDFQSFHHLSQKRSVASSLYKRAKDLCSEGNIKDEINNLEKLLIQNNYPKNLARY